ncbi:MAG: LysR family transcriptional regulator [Stomatobaculum sp.]|nr:LysR family transcriptional regulator [Stomatobaculum sp.]
MDTTSLMYFAEAAKDLNFTRTAKRLFISQQNLSNHISRLEEYYSVKLFERRPHLALTYAGEVLLSYTAKFRIDEDNLKNAFSDIREKERGVLKLGFSPTRTSVAIPKLTERFLAEFPNVQVQLHQLHSRDIADKLLSGELDIGLSTNLETFDRQNLETSVLFRDSLYLMVKRSLLEKHLDLTPSAADDLIGEAYRNGILIRDFIRLPFVDVRTANIFKDVFKYSGCEPNFIITLAYLTFSQPTMYENVAASVTTRTIYLHLKPYLPPDILFLPIRPIPGMPLHDISLIRHKKKYLPRHGQRFLDLTSDYFRALDAEYPPENALS